MYNLSIFPCEDHPIDKFTRVDWHQDMDLSHFLHTTVQNSVDFESLCAIDCHNSNTACNFYAYHKLSGTCHLGSLVGGARAGIIPLNEEHVIRMLSGKFIPGVPEIGVCFFKLEYLDYH